MADPRDERQLNDAAERFDGYLDALLGDGRPSPDTVGDRDEAEMARMAAELAASDASVSVVGSGRRSRKLAERAVELMRV